jgi:predicted permease
MTLWQDVRLAARLLAKDRWYTAVAVLTLGLGIGVNNTIFTFVNAVLLRGLPYHESHRIVSLSSRGPADSESDAIASYVHYEEWRAATRTFEDLAAFRVGTMNVSDSEHAPERMVGAWVSANMFGLLGQPTFLGRAFLADEDRPGAEAVAIIGYGLWQTRYGGAPDILGRIIRINEVPAKIVGVMPPGMKFPPPNADLWQPLVPNPSPRWRSTRDLEIVGRLKPGVSLSEARAEMDTIARRLKAQERDADRDTRIQVITYNARASAGQVRIIFLAMMGAVALVLLVACANVANLLLARSAARAREMAVRVSLGATRWQIVRQLLIESVLLGCVSGVVGLLLSYGGVHLFELAVADVGRPYWIEFTMDATVFAFLGGICVLTGVLFGLAPALHVSRANMNELLKDGGRGGGAGTRLRRFSSVMVVAEVALTIVVLTGAGLMVRSFLNLYSLELGFETRNLLGATTTLAERKYPDAAQQVRFQEQLLAQLQSVPGVGIAAVATNFPATGGRRMAVEIDGRMHPEVERAPRALGVSVSDEYFQTLGISLLRGRVFIANDGRPGNEAAIVNDRFVAQFLSGENPIGRRIRLREENRDSPWLVIVGVAPNVRQDNPQTLEPAAVVYTPFRQTPTRTIGILMRTTVPPAGVAGPLRTAVRNIDPDQPLYNLRTQEEALAQARWPWRVFGSLFVVFAFISLVLSAVGLYAVTAYSVAQRTQEIGVRIALGARQEQVSWLILRRGLIQLGAGLAIGLVGAYFASGVLRQMLVQMTPTDPITFVGITTLVLVVTVTACLLPARRAMRVDPVVALRAE